MGTGFLAAAGEATGTMSGLLGTFTEVFTWFMTQIGTLVTTVVENPLLMLMTAVLMVGAAIGIFTRLLKSV